MVVCVSHSHLRASVSTRCFRVPAAHRAQVKDAPAMCQAFTHFVRHPEGIATWSVAPQAPFNCLRTG
jgi:hypothetical protein